jgi:hypothetical protein
VLAIAATFAHLFAAPPISENDAMAAAPSAEPVRLSMVTSPCADEEAFWSALARHSTRIRRAAAGESAPVAEIEIVREGRRIVGRLRVPLDTDGASDAAATRTVAGTSCDEVVAAMSLMTALVFDADATSESPASQPVPPPQHDENAAAHAPSSGTSLAPTGGEAPASGAKAGALTERSWSLSGMADGHVLVSSSGGAWGGGVFVEVQRVSRERRLGAWLPALRLGATVSSLDVVVSPARAAVEWRVLQADACPWRAAISTWWTLRPCASAEGGVLDISAEGVANARSMSRPWVAAAARLRSTWTPVGAVEVGVEAASLFPLLRDDFKVAPSLSLFRAPVAALGFGISLGMRIL